MRFTVHVDCCADGNDETGDAWIDAHVIETIDGDGHGGRARTGTEGGGEDLRHLQHVAVGQLADDQEEDDGNGAEAVEEQAKQDGHEVFAQFADDLSEVLHLEDLGADQEEHADW